MPAEKTLAGVTNPRKVKKVIAQRPQLKAKLAKLHPELYGPDAEQPKEQKKKK